MVQSRRYSFPINCIFANMKLKHIYSTWHHQIEFLVNFSRFPLSSALFPESCTRHNAHVQRLRETAAGFIRRCAILGSTSHCCDITSNESSRSEYAFIHNFSFPPIKNILESMVHAAQPKRGQGMLGSSNHFRFRRSNISIVSRE